MASPGFPSDDHRSPAVRRRQGGFVLTLALVLFVSVVVVGSIVGFVAVRNALLKRAQINLIQDSSTPAANLGRPVDYDLCEAPMVYCRDPGPGDSEGLLATVGVRPDRLTTRNQVFYAGADCVDDPLDDTDVYLAPPAVPPHLPPLLPVGYQNGALLVDAAGNRTVYGVGAARGWDPVAGSPTGPGLLYRGSLAPAATAPMETIESVWTSMAPDCLLDQGVPIEAGTVVVDDVPTTTVALANTYASPVIVTTIDYGSNGIGIPAAVTRISAVTSTSFDIHLQRPSGGPLPPRTVHYLVVEEGSWDVGGVQIDAQKYLSTVTDENGSWVGELQSYGQAFTAPVVLGQVMSENDPDWSVFWSRGPDPFTPPTSAVLYTGKHVGEDPDVTRAPETIGFVVFETGHGLLEGVEYEAALGPDTITHTVGAYPFLAPFASTAPAPPAVGILSQAAMDGPDGSWAILRPGRSFAAFTLSVEEDRFLDGNPHTTEQVAYAWFAEAFALGGGSLGLCTNTGSLTLSLLTAEEVVDGAGDNVLEAYTPPFVVEAPALTFFPVDPAGEAAPVVVPPGPITDPGADPRFPAGGAEGDAPLPEDAPGPMDEGADTTFPPPPGEDG